MMNLYRLPPANLEMTADHVGGVSGDGISPELLDLSVTGEGRDRVDVCVVRLNVAWCLYSIAGIGSCVALPMSSYPLPCRDQHATVMCSSHDGILYALLLRGTLFLPVVMSLP